MTTAAQPLHDSNNLRKWVYPNALYRAVLSKYLDRMAALVKDVAPASVLDAGCGEGFVYRFLRERGVRVSRWEGVDASPGAVAYARTQSPECRWQVGDLRQLPLPMAHADLVLCSQVLEHIPQPEAVRDELARVSARWLLVSVPWEPVFRTVCAATVATGVAQDPGHVNFWNGRQFRSFWASVGRVVHWERSAVYQIALVEKHPLAHP